MHQVSVSSAPNGPDPSGDHASPPALRNTRSRWRDTRLWIGVLIVLASVVVGARLLAAADRTVEVWQLSDGVSAGTAIDTGSVHAVRVHFDDASAEARYLAADQAIPDDATVTRDVGPGELLPVDAIGSRATADVVQLPLLVPANGFPSNLAVGDRVEVWATSGETGGHDPAAQVLAGAQVVAMSSGDFATSTSDRSVVVALGAASDIQRLLDDLVGRDVVLLRVGD